MLALAQLDVVPVARAALRAAAGIARHTNPNPNPNPNLNPNPNPNQASRDAIKELCVKVPAEG